MCGGLHFRCLFNVLVTWQSQTALDTEMDGVATGGSLDNSAACELLSASVPLPGTPKSRQVCAWHAQ